MPVKLEKLHLHIGLEKTGTSSVQLFFAKSQPGLLRTGLLYPMTFRPRPEFDNHAGLAAAAQLDDSDAEMTRLSPRQAGESRAMMRDRLAGSFMQELAEHRATIAVISSEHLSSRLRSISEVRNVADMLGRIDVRELAVHVMLRNQVDMAASWYATTIKGGETRHLDQIQLPELLPYLSFAAVIDRWRVAFGASAMRVYSFDELRAKGIDAVEQMRRVTGVPDEIPYPRRRSVNASLNRQTAEIVRRMNVLGRHRFRVESWDDVVETLSVHGSGERIRLPRALHLGIVRAFERENRDVEQRHFENRRVLASSSPKPGDENVRVQLTAHDLISLIRELAARQGQPEGPIPLGEEALLGRIAELAEALGRAVRLGTAAPAGARS